MAPAGLLQLVVLVVLLAVTVPPLGRYLAAVLGDPDVEGEPGPAPGDRAFRPVERAIYRLGRIDPSAEQRWTGYATSLLAFSLVSILVLYAQLRLQGHLPGNPEGRGGIDAPVAFNTAISFVTNTDWQAYSGEVSMSHLSQMTGLTVQNFASAAAGMGVVAAAIRGLTRRGAATLGNFWVDLVRIVVRVLLPLSVVAAVLLVSQGVVQNLGVARRRGGPPHADGVGARRATRPPPRAAGEPAPAPPGGVGPAVRDRDELPPGPHGQPAPQGRGRPVAAPPLPHRARHGLPVRRHPVALRSP